MYCMYLLYAMRVYFSSVDVLYVSNVCNESVF